MRNHRFFHFMAALWMVLAAFAQACGDDASEGAEVTLTGTKDLFPDLGFSTGLQPSGAPVQASFSVTAAATAELRAGAIPSGSADDPTLAGVAQRGTLTLKGGFAMVGQLKVDVGSLSYDGPIPQLGDVVIPFEGTTTFDPFSIGKEITATAPITPTKLPGIPLPGGLPGELVLEIAEGSVATVVLTPKCAGVNDDGTATYEGSLARGGTLRIRPSVAIKVPILGDKTFDIPELSVDLALGTIEILATAKVASFGDKPDTGDHVEGSCQPSDGTGGASGTTTSTSAQTGATTTTTTVTATSSDASSSTGILPGTATVTIDGAVMTVTSAEVFEFDPNSIFIKFQGPNFSEPGSDLALDVYAAGEGCGQGNKLWLRPGVDNEVYVTQYISSSTADCGLSIPSAGHFSGGRTVGTFDGILTPINFDGQGPTTVHVIASFDVPANP